MFRWRSLKCDRPACPCLPPRRPSGVESRLRSALRFPPPDSRPTHDASPFAVARTCDTPMNKNLQPTWKALLIGGLLAWAYFPTLRGLFQKWMDDPQYSHGILVPLL